jgi:predicted metalloprotease with PDZ domain
MPNAQSGTADATRSAFRLRHSAVIALFLIVWILPATSVLGQPSDSIKYTLRFPAPHTHYVEVEAAIPAGRGGQTDVYMAVWTPGSYLVRDYSRHVEGLTAKTTAGAALTVEKTAKNRWRVASGAAPSFTLSYRVYGREMTVRTNWIEDGFAMLNGAPTFITLADRSPRPHEVAFELPPTWQKTMTSLDPAGGPHRYRAPDFDTLVDSPILAGNPAVYEFQVDGKPHFLVNEGEAGVFDGARAVKDVEEIVREHRRLWGFLPYERYFFLNVLSEAGGGLEHQNSTLLMASRWATSTRRRYLAWLGLVSHEYFHAWNVKRLRPVELGPFDYEREVHTTGLWISEGFTDYYGDLGIHRAGLTTRDEYLRELSGLIESVQTTPGRLIQPLETASFDAWIRHYRPDENSPNVAMSYYTKGAVVAWLLDAKVRRATGGTKSLDDVMRLAYERHAGPKGFTEEEFRKAVSDVGAAAAGAPAAEWLKRVVETTDELDYREALDWFGLRFAPSGSARLAAGQYQWQGLRLRSDDGRLLVSNVYRGTPAYDAGVIVDDEIVATGDFRVRPDQWEGRVETFGVGQKVSLLVSRRDELKRIDLTVGKEPALEWRLTQAGCATEAQKRNLERWLALTAESTPGRPGRP